MFRIRVRIQQCCWFGMFITDPGSEFFPSRILDPGKKRFPDPGSGSAIASHNLSILTKKIVSELSWIGYDVQFQWYIWIFAWVSCQECIFFWLYVGWRYSAQVAEFWRRCKLRLSEAREGFGSGIQILLTLAWFFFCRARGGIFWPGAGTQDQCSGHFCGNLREAR